MADVNLYQGADAVFIMSAMEEAIKECSIVSDMGPNSGGSTPADDFVRYYQKEFKVTPFVDGDTMSRQVIHAKTGKPILDWVNEDMRRTKPHFFPPAMSEDFGRQGFRARRRQSEPDFSGGTYQRDRDQRCPCGSHRPRHGSRLDQARCAQGQCWCGQARRKSRKREPLGRSLERY
jgi:hypothetical protein